MSMRTKRIAPSALALLAGLGLAASAHAEDKKWHVGAAVYGLQNEYAQRWSADIAKHPAVVSGLVDLTVFDGKYDHLTQRSQFDTMETQKYDGAIYVTIDSKACDAVVKKAVTENLPVVGSNSPCDSTAEFSYIGSDDVQAGRDVATAVIGRIQGGGGVVELEGPVGQLGAIQRGQGMKEVLAKHPEIKLLESKTANWSRQEAFKIMQDWITAHPGEIKGILAQNDEMALGAIRALKAAGIDPKTVPVAGVDGVTDAVKAVNDGEMILSVAQDSHAQSQGALDIILRRLIGPSYKPESDTWQTYKDKMPWGDGTAKLYNVPWTYITAENAKQFLK
jgi:ABC-type sugar transport system substrate-binding protein